MSKLKVLSVLVALFSSLPLVGVASSWAQTPGPTISFQGTYPLTVDAGDYDLTYLVLDFAPGQLYRCTIMAAPHWWWV